MQTVFCRGFQIYLHFGLHLILLNNLSKSSHYLVGIGCFGFVGGGGGGSGGGDRIDRGEGGGI